MTEVCEWQGESNLMKAGMERGRGRERATPSAMMAMSEEPREVACATTTPAIASGVGCGSELAV
jgi:hypothetical protein